MANSQTETHKEKEKKVSKYVHSIHQLAKKKTRGIHNNMYPEVAGAIFEDFFKLSRNNTNPTIRIFAESIESISKSIDLNNYLDEFYAYITQHPFSKIQLLLKSPFKFKREFTISSLLYSFSLLPEYKDRVKIKYLNNVDIDHLYNSNEIFESKARYFATANEDMFRLELDSKRAKFSFNETKITHSLNEIFNTLFEQDKYSSSKLNALNFVSENGKIDQG